MSMRDAIPAIGNALVNLGRPTDGREDTFMLRTFPYKMIWNPNPGKPSMRVKYDGISDDSGNGTPITKSPSSVRFEVQIVHPEFGPPEANPRVEDGVEYAQFRVLDGTSVLYEALQDDPMLGDLVINSEVVGSVTGPLTVNRRDFYGEEIIIVCTLY